MNTQQHPPGMLKAPFPWFGGKSRVAGVVWERFGDVPNYVEPFAGSLAVLLGRPHAPRVETVNDLDCYLANFWRALANEPEEVAVWADWPVNEADLHARHRWLVDHGEFRERMKTDPDWFDARVAGWWVWGVSQWIGSGWCSRPEWRGRAAAYRMAGINAKGKPPQKRVNLGKGGMGVPQGEYLWQTRPFLSSAGQGVHGLARSAPDISPDGIGMESGGVHGPGRTRGDLYEYFAGLASRLRRVRVCCGDWARILGPSPTFKIGLTGVFLDPPYGDADRDADIYACDSKSVAGRAREWALEAGKNPLLRVALCGYEGEHVMPADWECYAWRATGGYGVRANGRGKANRARERIWFSPACLKAERELF